MAAASCARIWVLVDAARGRGAGRRHLSVDEVIAGPGRTRCGVCGRLAPALRGSALPECAACLDAVPVPPIITSGARHGARAGTDAAVVAAGTLSGPAEGTRRW
jgi:hypothetical protein